MLKFMAITIPCAGIVATWAIKKYGESKKDEKPKNVDRNPDRILKHKNDLKTANKDVGLDVGCERFATGVKEVTDLLHKSHINAGKMAYDGPQLGSLILAWARICEILGPQLEPYLQMAIPLVIQAANMETDLHLEDDDAVENNMEIKITEDIKRKAIDLKTLATFVAGVKEDSSDADKACELILKNINFVEVNIRRAAVQSCRVVCEYAKYKDRKYKKTIFFSIVENIVNEPNKEVLLEKLDLLVVCMKTFGAKLFDSDIRIKIDQILRKIFEIHDKNKGERSKSKDDEANHGQLLNTIYDIIHALLIIDNQFGIETYFLELIKGPVNDLLIPEEPWEDQLFALRTVNEVIEDIGLEWDKWYDDKEKMFIEGTLEKIMRIIDCRPPAVVLEAAFHGIGLLGLHQGAIIKKFQSGPEYFTKPRLENLKKSKLFQNLKEAAIKLEKCIETEYTKDPEFLSAREKASDTLLILNMNIMPIAEQANTAEPIQLQSQNIFLKITNIFMNVKNRIGQARFSWARLDSNIDSN
ncbi:hypothetical protein QYM36_016965 [Artemia franciscana]|uniref:Uncharacterized protein n=1 Tax=Artemia franciscana TaxID=6661 RepID=A0AA88HGC3_ARTSF|nr:hypothetical protein QYM36_016965 [Artemia franciscana]